MKSRKSKPMHPQSLYTFAQQPAKATKQVKPKLLPATPISKLSNLNSAYDNLQALRDSYSVQCHLTAKKNKLEAQLESISNQNEYKLSALLQLFSSLSQPNFNSTLINPFQQYLTWCIANNRPYVLGKNDSIDIPIRCSFSSTESNPIIFHIPQFSLTLENPLLLNLIKLDNLKKLEKNPKEMISHIESSLDQAHFLYQKLTKHPFNWIKESRKSLSTLSMDKTMKCIFHSRKVHLQPLEIIQANPQDSWIFSYSSVELAQKLEACETLEEKLDLLFLSFYPSNPSSPLKTPMDLSDDLNGDLSGDSNDDDE